MSDFHNRSYVGIDAIVESCSKVYPDQLNPTQATSVVKYWLGGSECLDYISIYHGPGDETSSAHWHYVTFGFSDLHGDGRVHQTANKNDPEAISGYGFELTFRLRKPPECGNSAHQIPLWPCKLLQYLAKYVFQTGSRFHTGHHIPMGHVLPSLYASEGHTLIKDLLLTQDRQLKSFRTALGSVEFLQLVGVFDVELEAAQECNVAQVIDLLGSDRKTGGPLLVTSMIRDKSVFDINPHANLMIKEKISKEGSQLGRVLARCSWKASSPSTNENVFCLTSSIELTFDLDAAKIFVKILRSRLRRGKWFIFDSLTDQSICLVSTGANNPGIMVDSIQQMMILGNREAQIMLLPEQIDLCIDRMSNILDIKDGEERKLKYDFPFHENIQLIIVIIPASDFANENA